MKVVWLLKTFAPQINAKSIPFPADESGIMLNFVFAVRPSSWATMQDNETKKIDSRRSEINFCRKDFCRFLYVYARALSC